MPTGIYDRSKSKPNNGLFKKGQIGEKSISWKGGKTIGSDGYILVLKHNHPFRQKSGHVREHRLVMEKRIGRYLQPFEKVHHINGIKTDNRIENLLLFDNNIKHLKHHISNTRKFGFQKGHPSYTKNYFFKKGNPPVPHKINCHCFRCAHRSPNPNVKNHLYP